MAQPGRIAEHAEKTSVPIRISMGSVSAVASARPLDLDTAHLFSERALAGREGHVATVDRNEFLRGALAAGAASFASSVATNYTAHLEPSSPVQELANVMRLLDAASDRLVGALADARDIDPAVVSALETINEKARAIAGQVEMALPLG